jgi:uncharacterized protein DUF6531
MARTRILILIAFAGMALLDPNAFGQCTPTIDSVSFSGGYLSVTATNTSDPVCNPFATTVAVTINGVTGTGPYPNDGNCPWASSCTTTAVFPASCWAPGPVSIVASGSCYKTDGQYCYFITTGTATTSFSMPSRKPTVNVTVDDDNSTATVYWQFQNVSAAEPRVAWLDWAPSGERIWTGVELPMTGNSGPIPLPACAADGREFVLGAASVCGDADGYEETRQPVVLPKCVAACSSCSTSRTSASTVASNSGSLGPGLGQQGTECVSMPIRVDNGNMKMTDRDELPGTLLAPLTRTYDTLRTNGIFGRGWSSIFDSKLTVQGQHVFLKTEDGDLLVFVKEGSDYRQVWPTIEEMTGWLRYDSTESAYLHRPQGANITRVYVDGRLSSLRVAGRLNRVNITYDASGLPTRVEDSQGVWGWTVTTSGGRISAIVPDGTSSYTWAYIRDGNGDLTSVTTSTGTWRTYTYASGRMTEARDGEGNLLESHAYETSGRATTSVSGGEEVTGLQYRQTGRVAGETKAIVTYASGRTTTYYTRNIAGRPRTVEVDGSCDCGSEDAVYMHDAAGRLIREQMTSATSPHDSTRTDG